MIEYTQGNLLEAPVEALVNTVNTVGVMGKGIALMFKERFPANMQAYAQACKQQQVQTGHMFITETGELMGPRWIVNFPTKQHWRGNSRMEWVESGLQDLRRFIVEQQVQSIAIPPLGAGNGGLSWADVKPRIEAALGDIPGVQVLVYEPTAAYQNVAKRNGVQNLTEARALVAELVRRYWLLGIDCSLLEIQKLAWFLQRAIQLQGLPDKLQLNFVANNYGPYANNLDHLLNALDGSYLKAEKRIPDSDPLDVIWFRDETRDKVQAYLNSAAKDYVPALEMASAMIEGFESPYGMELLATVDWLLTREGVNANVADVRAALQHWPAGARWAQRKNRLFDDNSLHIAIERLARFQAA
ncbi:Appr-1-p processing protein [Venatoribacter cucullus]|uniref:Appr-1-p processing protein n=1 Tax=Venatoribacter cucullus TaxID=2661630 RepID=A0A9X7UWR5_9GAMM|nr:macro domain-containing protein [Venatoribacter cucullus]QQD24335.1 Appr-1-p processing protein [Venatoribacter cucullus]